MEDEIVPLGDSEEMVRALREAGNERVELTVMPGRGHGILIVYEDGELHGWLLRVEGR